MFEIAYAVRCSKNLLVIVDIATWRWPMWTGFGGQDV